MALTTRRRALTTLGAALAGSVALPASRALAGEEKHHTRPLWRAHAHNDYEHPRPCSTPSTTASAASRPTSTSSATNSLSPTTRSSSTRPAPSNPLPRPARRPREGPPRLGLPGTPAAPATPHRHQDRGLVDVPRTRPPSEPLPAPVHHLRARPGAPGADHRGDLRRPRRPYAHGGAERAARLLRRQAHRPRQRGPASFIPLISDNWTLNFTWSGDGPFPDAERAKLRGIIAAAHRRHQKVRFWATPTWRARRARRCGASYWPPTSTTSTPTTSPGSKPSSTRTSRRVRVGRTRVDAHEQAHALVCEWA